jgi:acetyl-CoA carboxylase biotin carboxyl carrier protein
MKSINAMMAGTVIEVLVKQGDSIADGQEIVILESMKMQLPVAADQTGKVKEIKIASGDFVNEGDALVILD